MILQASMFPESWEPVPLKYLLRRRSVKGKGDALLLSIYRDHGVVPKESRDDNFNRAGKDLDSYLFIEAGNLVINKMKAWQGSVAVSKHTGIVSPAYFAFDVSPRVHGRFLHHQLRSNAFVQEFKRLSDGVRPNQWDLDLDEFGRCEARLPPLPTQKAIATFLDRKTAAIDALIEKKQKLLDVLSEKRAALINQAVTKGLDPNVPMKDSGIPWIGEIPAHWHVLAIKRFAKPGYKTFTDGDWIESPYITTDGVRLVQTGNIGIGNYREKGFRYVSHKTFGALRCTEVRPGDLLICRLDGPVGRACMAPSLGVKMITSVDNAILKLGPQHDARYLNYGLNLPSRLDWIGYLVQVGGGHRWRISRTMLGALFLPCPPPDEQRAIADELDGVAARIVEANGRIDQQMQKLKEYRQALITAAVTGQLDIDEEAA